MLPPYLGKIIKHFLLKFVTVLPTGIHNLPELHEAHSAIHRRLVCTVLPITIVSREQIVHKFFTYHPATIYLFGTAIAVCSESSSEGMGVLQSRWSGDDAFNLCSVHLACRDEM